jgi:hypothetical protein
MLTLKGCYRLTGIVGLLSRNTGLDSLLLNCTVTNLQPYIEVPLSILHNKHKNKVDLSARAIHSLLRTENTLKHVKLSKNLQQKRYFDIAAKLVNNASPQVQPYMKLMRIDKPIGDIYFSITNY